MTVRNRFLMSFLCGAVLCVPVHANNCDNPQYRIYNPDKCAPEKSFSFFSTTGAAITGGTAILGGALALFGLSSGGDGGSSHSDTITATMNTNYSHVGADVDSVQLASIVTTDDYARNANQYNDIRLGYSLARGYTGQGTTIAVLDSAGTGSHGEKVAGLASGQIAPNAKVDIYDIVDDNDDFVPYSVIGDTIARASNANVYNFSWSVAMRANEVRSRAQMASLTDTNFINQLSVAAKNDAIFVVAAGNDYDKSQPSALSALPKVMPELKGHYVTVVAWDSETGELADFSNACGSAKNWCITAPGANIDSGTKILHGTSFSTPIVSAAIAVIREAFPYMNAESVTDLLFSTARDLGDTGVDATYGHGMLDLERATRPVGTELIPISDTVTTVRRAANIRGTIGTKIKDANIKFAFIDSYGRAFDANLSDNISIKNRGHGISRLHDNTAQRIEFGNFEFGFKKNDLLSGDGFLATDTNSMISFVGVKNTFHIGNTEFFQHATIGSANPRPAPQSMITEFSNIQTASVRLGARANDWTFEIAIPDTIISGNMNLHIPTGRTASGAYTFRDYNLNLAETPAVEYVVSYKNITAGFVDNPYGTDEFYMLAKTHIEF